MHVDTAVAPTTCEYLPRGQDSQSVAASFPVVAKYLPDGQAMQSDPWSLPVNGAYLPAGQTTHAAFPVTSLNLPASHAKHEAPVCPALHEQALMEVLPCGEPAFLGQLVQSSPFSALMARPMKLYSESKIIVVERLLPKNPEPENSLYLPAGHAEHSPPFLPVYPALHEQNRLPCCETPLLGQLMQLPVPDVFLYVPTGQSMQTAVPDATLNLPGRHAAHEPERAKVPEALHSAVIVGEENWNPGLH